MEAIGKWLYLILQAHLTTSKSLRNSPGKGSLMGMVKGFCKPKYFSRRDKSAKSTYFRKISFINVCIRSVKKSCLN